MCKLDLALAIRECRKSVGLTQREAARQLGITDVHLCNLEHGKSQPSLKLIAWMEQAFGVNVYLWAWFSLYDLDGAVAITDRFRRRYQQYYGIIKEDV